MKTAAPPQGKHGAKEVFMVEMYPRVFKSGLKQTLYIKLSEDIRTDSLEIKLQPMEKYSIPHTPALRIDENGRYPFVPMTACGDGVYSFEYDFLGEQQYTVRVASAGEVIYTSCVYALDEDLAALQAFKGDLHLHSCRSDGVGTPFEVACDYRAAGYDFIALTDHHKFAPSQEAQAAVKEKTDAFYVFRGEEVHNKSMGMIHIINFNGESSVNDIIETDDEYVNAEIDRIMAERDLSALSDPRCVAYRIFIAEHIRKANGLAILAHPFWPYGEYHMQTEETVYHLKNGDFDAFEVLAGCDEVGHGNNLQEMLYFDLVAEGYRTPVVGSSDAHFRAADGPFTLVHKQFTLVFAKDFDEIPDAIRDFRSVAVERQSEKKFHVIGSFRYVKYARYLMQYFYPTYATLCAAHASAMASGTPDEIKSAEAAIAEYQAKFFA